MVNDTNVRNQSFDDINFEELLTRVREIRNSEKRFYAKVRDLFALAYDYDKRDGNTVKFFSEIQNCLLFAVSGQTGPQLISARANSYEPNMGLTAFNGGTITKAEVTVAKNYLREEELRELNVLVSRFFDYAEDQTARHIAISLDSWRSKFKEFLKFNEFPTLENAGPTARIAADTHAKGEYSKYKTKH